MRTDILASTTFGPAASAAARRKVVPVFGPVPHGGCPR